MNRDEVVEVIVEASGDVLTSHDVYDLLEIAETGSEEQLAKILGDWRRAKKLNKSALKAIVKEVTRYVGPLQRFVAAILALL